MNHFSFDPPANRDANTYMHTYVWVGGYAFYGPKCLCMHVCTATYVYV